MSTAPGGSTREAVGGGEDGAAGRGETGVGPPGDVAGTGPAGGADGTGPTGGAASAGLAGGCRRWYASTGSLYRSPGGAPTVGTLGLAGAASVEVRVAGARTHESWPN
jgi:hypothetical protein